MKIKIIENLDKNNDLSFDSINTPLTYRVSLSYDKDTIIIKREYFRVGYHDGEGINKYFYNNNKCGYTDNDQLTYASFITRDLNNEKLKKESEQRLVKGFMKECLKCEDLIKSKLQKEIVSSKSKLQKYNNIYTFLDKEFNRREKIEKILKRCKQNTIY